jgi:hypothetical protein
MSEQEKEEQEEKGRRMTLKVTNGMTFCTLATSCSNYRANVQLLLPYSSSSTFTYKALGHLSMQNTF